MPASNTTSPYVVTFNDGYVPGGEDVSQDPLPVDSDGTATPQSRAMYTQAVGTAQQDDASLAQASSICNDYGATCDVVYSAGGGFHAQMTSAQAQSMSLDSRVAAVEADGPSNLPDSESLDTSPGFGPWQWGLDAIDQTTNNLDGLFHYATASQGTGVNVFVLDDGIAAGHSEFGSRVKPGYNVLNPSANSTSIVDNDGHGTQIASVIGGNLCGVAKNVNLISIKMMEHISYYSNSIAALDWVLKNYKSFPGVSVVHFSAPLDPKNKQGTQLNKEVDKLLDKGIPVIVPANNYNVDVKDISPANDGRVITVGAVGMTTPGGDYGRWVPSPSTKDWNSGSGYGSGVDVFAPGVNVKAAYYLDPNGFGSWTGTSLAAPFVTGAVAAYLGVHPKASLSTISNWIRSSARACVSTTNRGSGSANRFLYLNPAGLQ